MRNKLWSQHTAEVKEVLSSVRQDHINNLIEGIWETYGSQKQFFICGNGGSALNASHFAQDLSKGVIENGNSKPRIRAISLCNDIGFITATSNDDCYDNIFVNQLIIYANHGDSLFVLSGSGNSENVVRAVDYAKSNEINTYGILGYAGGILKAKLQKYIHINYNHMETCEAVMSVILHYIMCELKSRYESNRSIGI
jgi:D-sedoheptulose 7-phosphate isomerase